MTDPSHSITPSAAVAAPHWSRWVAGGLALVLGGLAAWHVWSPTARSERAQRMAAELGAELFDRPLSAAELDTPLQLHPQAKTAQGDTATLRQLLTGHDAVLVHHWASWCPPCLEELPEIAALAQSAHGRNCQVLAVSYDDDWAAADATLRKVLGQSVQPMGLWVRDPQGQGGDEAKMLRLRMGTEKLPETWVVADGRVRARFVAGQRWTSAKMMRWLAAQCPGSR
ncbi:MAG: TlpA family protein disulfide reductase [Deltaproteobacteria bacterium]|nr:TlpA family protein disulfide reductase [Deltaproteobacteria bacterium]